VGDLRTLPLASLIPHPDNPRLQSREDVVERIAAEIGRSGFGEEHALLVRPVDGAYQIIAGHHRREAASRAGVAEVPCWVKDLADDEAFMQLVLANAQGELDPLERGLHALTAERYADGGLRAYAERIGAKRERISVLRSAARVAKECGSTHTFLGKSEHLYEISKAPRAAWSLLAERLTARGWTVAETLSQVEKIRKFSIPPEHSYWLSLDAVIEAYLRSDRLNPAAVAKLVATAEGVLAYISQEGTDEDREAFAMWLRDNAGKDSWDARKIGRYHADLIREVGARRAAEAEAAAEDDEPSLPEGVDLRAGDFREVLKDLDGTVDAIITDPPYPEEFLPLFADLSEVAARILKPGGICAVMVGQSYLPQIMAALGRHLIWHWPISYETPGGQAVQLWQRKVNTFWKPVLIYVKGTYGGDWFGDVARSAVNDNDKRHHHWGQSESGIADLIERLTKPGQLICDPFLGGGTTGVVAHDLARRFVGCDLDESCITTTVERFVVTEPAA
jgi:site-specific DNA-methyltransferase (adenine-specific)